MFPPPALITLFLSKVLAELVMGKFRLLFLVAPSWMNAPLFPTVFNSLEDVLHWCCIIRPQDRCFSIPGAQGSTITAFNPLADQTCVVQTTVLFLSLSGCGKGDLSVCYKSLPKIL